MGAWGIGVYQNDSALDYMFQLEDLVRLDMWKQLKIYVNAKQDTDGEWYIEEVYYKPSNFLGKDLYSYEECLLAWVDIVLKLNVMIYEEQRLGAYHMLTYCIKQIKKQGWRNEELENQRLKLLKKYRTKISKYERIIGLFVPQEYSYGYKEENITLKMQKDLEKNIIDEDFFNYDIDEDFYCDIDVDLWLGWKEEFEERFVEEEDDNE